MRNLLGARLLVCVLLGAGLSIAAQAATTPKTAAVDENLPTFLATGDAMAGEQKSATCAACHGAKGISAIPANPNLAGQGAAYIVQQLMAFKSGERNNAIMAGMVAALQPQDMQDLAAFYASQPAAEGVSKAEGLELGQNIYRGGVTSVGIPACYGCHGPAGAGNDAASYPALAGQHAEYTATSLKNYRAGTRGGEGNPMNAVAARLSDQEIDALANYLQGLY